MPHAHVHVHTHVSCTCTHLIILHKGGEVLDNIGMVELLQQVNLLDAVLPCFGIHHVKYLSFTPSSLSYLADGTNLT